MQETEASAWLDFAEGNSEEALRKMKTAVAKEDSFRVESVSVPAYEMLGDLWMELGDPQQALSAYEAALKEAPGRFDAL